MKTPAVGCLCALMGFLLGVGIVLSFRTPSAKKVQPEPPDVAGAKVPAKLFSIDFNRRYDIICNNEQGDPLNYRNCRILGFTGEQSQQRDYYGSSGDYLDHWLVLQLPDGRKAYLPPTQILAFEEARGKR